MFVARNIINSMTFENLKILILGVCSIFAIEILPHAHNKLSGDFIILTQCIIGVLTIIYLILKIINYAKAKKKSGN